MSQNDDANWTHFNVRCEKELRKRAEADARNLGQSFAEWIRRAMMEKLERVQVRTSAEPVLAMSDGELKELVRKLMLEIKSETKTGFGQK